MKKTYITPASEGLALAFEGMIAASTKAEGITIGSGSSTTITEESGFYSAEKGWNDNMWSGMEE